MGRVMSKRSLVSTIGSLSSLIRCCPGLAVIGAQQLLAGQLRATVHRHLVSQHPSLDHADICQPQPQPRYNESSNLVLCHQLRLQQHLQPGTASKNTGLLPRLGLHAASIPNCSSIPGCVAGLRLFQRHYARSCSESVEDELATAATASPSRRRRGRTTNSSDAAAPAATAAAATAGVDALSIEGGAAAAGADVPSHRRGTTESRALLRRTTEIRAAIEDVAVMTKSQLMRRNKAWLQHECWSRKLPYDALKPDLVQQLLDWQQTEAGKGAASAALATADAGRVAAAIAAGAEQQQEQQEGTLQQPIAQAGSIDSSSRTRRRSTSNAAMNSSSSKSADENQLLASDAAAAVAVASNRQPQQPPRNAAAAAADSLTALLQQLQAQPDNAALLAVARNFLELHVKSLMADSQATSSSSSSSSMSGSSWCAISSSRGWGSGVATASAAAAVRAAALQEAVSDLASQIQTASSPASIATLATACYSREVQSHVLAAAMSKAVASVAPQLGPQEVYRVLRLLVEHLGGAAPTSCNTDNDGGTSGAAAGCAGGEVSSTLRRGFQVLAQALIGCCSALAPMQLAEAVALLARHHYDDAWGLWLISKEAADRLAEFEPCDMVLLLDAVAGMCVADDVLCTAAAEAVGAKRGAYSAAQLAGVANSLQRMGYAGGV